MTANSNAKLKMLYIMRMLQEETDADHGLSMRQIIEGLEAEGIEAERKGIYRDVELLREFGLSIETYQRNPVEYAIARRDFNLSELMLMADAVQSCRFITKGQSEALVRNIQLLASEHEREKLSKRIHVAGRIKSKNESVFGNVDLVHDALRRRMKISFLYYKHGPDKERVLQHEGKPYVVTPVKLVFADGFYYLTAWNSKHAVFNDYRLDRMEDLRVAAEGAERNEMIREHVFDESEYEYFGRFGGRKTTTTLGVAADKVDIVIDRFGMDARISKIDEERAQAVVVVRKSEQFYGWVAGMGGKVTILKPKSLVEDYKAYLRTLLEQA